MKKLIKRTALGVGFGFKLTAMSMMLSPSTSFAENTANGNSPTIASTDYLQLSTQDLNQRSAEGDDRATFQIANRALKGLGQPADPKSAFALFKSLADKGSVDAQLNVGRMYAQGKGTERDYKAAMHYLEAPAKKGDGRAVFMLADIQEQTHASLAMAYTLYKRVTMDNAIANAIRDVAQRKVNTLSAMLSTHDIDNAESKLQQWLSPKEN